MADRNLEKYRKRLLAEKTRLESQRERLQRRAAGERSSGPRIGGDGGLSDDAGALMAEREKHEALHENLNLLLAQVSDALGKVEAGTYGLCDACGKPIADARIAALPFATLCIRCQSRLERS
ncbi:MAG TPA: TraR/DksA C4-type zinc finger protein [Chthonomonadales bacterium]|nr:TraR/DksA C4-type zinc finger protein [Chthonomonadales bacterium]